MELIRKSKATKFKYFIFKIFDDNLFLLASSVSYYSAVAIAPFLLILLGVAGLIGSDVQSRFTTLAENMSPEFGQMVEIIFQNAHERVDLSSVSGLTGIFILFFTASLVFLQLRYAFDVIYGHHETMARPSVWEQVLEKLFAMFVVFVAGIILIVTSSIPGILKFLFPEAGYEILARFINFVIYIGLFWGIHSFTPTKRPGTRDAFMMSLLSSVFFVIGNYLLGFYFKTVTMSSIYGAASTLLVFLIWSYYSSFTLFLSAEIYLYYRKSRRQKL